MMKPVLIVEDNDDLRALYEYAITGEGYPAVTANNGQVALELLESDTPAPCLIILDLMMPVMDGWEFLRQREKSAKLSAIPVIVCTAVKDDTPPGVPFLRKPLDLSVLLETVEKYCKGAGQKST